MGKGVWPTRLIVSKINNKIDIVAVRVLMFVNVLYLVSYCIMYHIVPCIRGVQYVHWVMHKCIMVKVGGKNTRKVCKNLLNFLENRGESLKSRGKCTKTGKLGGKSEICG